MLPRVPFIVRAVPCVLAFFSSFCVMVVELVAGRVIAPSVGMSLHTWTAVIGIVLLGMTVGNLIGGRLADRFHTRKLCAILFVAAAFACISILFLNYLVGPLDLLGLSSIDSWPLRICAHVILVFLLPATALGFVGPTVAKMALDLGLQPGKTVGNVYAWGAIGMILGTFATGFFLTQYLGVWQIVVTMASLLALVGLAIAASVRWGSDAGGTRANDAVKEKTPAEN